jgi:nucleotide-binding universal stress UspA family protein
VKPPDTILLPLDVHKCPLEAFSYINQIAGLTTTVILLHVVNLNVVSPDGRIFDELACVAEKDLARLSKKFLSQLLNVRHQVRFGRPADEILGVAVESGVDLIVLTSHGNNAFWKRTFHPRIVEKVLRSARCDMMLLHVKTYFDCQEDGLYANEIVASEQS